MFSASIDKESLDQLPLATFQGEIVVVDSMAQLKAATAYLSTQRILGFDTETRPMFSKGGKRHHVALLQLAGRDRAYLFRLNRIGLPKQLISILENEDIIKVGAAIRDDIASLARLHPFEHSSFVDLQHVVETFGIENKSVKKMAAIILNVRISKSQQLSNWECDEYTEAQKQYAATDAWVCREIYLELGRRRLQKQKA